MSVTETSALQAEQSRRLPWSGAQLRYLIALAVNSLGNGVFMTLSAIYFVRFGSLSTLGVGVTLGIASVGGLLIGPYLGHLSDRHSPKRLYAMLLGVQALGVLLYVLTTGLPLAVLVFLVAIAERGAAAARGALVAQLAEKDERVRLRAFARSTTNATAAIGAAAGGLVLATSSRGWFVAGLLFDAATFLVASLLVTTIACAAPALPTPVRSPEKAHGSSFGAAWRNRGFVLVTILNGILLLHASMLTLGVPLWIHRSQGAPLWLISVFTLINMLGVVFLQVPASKSVTDLRSGRRVSRRAGLCLTASAVCIASSGGQFTWLSGLLLLAGALLHLGGELWQSASAWAFSYDLAPEESLGEYQGVFNSGMDLAMMISPVIFAFVVVQGIIGWLVLAALFLVVSIAMPFAVRYAEKEFVTLDER